jgi:uncharacterized protein Smg (DUF494 family)
MQITHPQNVFKKREKVNMSNIKPDEDGNYTEKQWDNLPVAKRMRLCASGEYEIQRSDMTDAARYIKKLETYLKNAKSNTIKQGIMLTNMIQYKGDRIEKLEAALRGLVVTLNSNEILYMVRNRYASAVAEQVLEGKDD